MNLVREWMSSRFRIAVFALGLAAVALYELARKYYRDFVYSNVIDDLHLADTLGNTLGTMATTLILASVFGRTFEQGLFVLRAAVIGVVVYEVAHPLLGKPIDPWDVLATVIAGAVSESVYRLARRFPGTATTG